MPLQFFIYKIWGRRCHVSLALHGGEIADVFSGIWSARTGFKQGAAVQIGASSGTALVAAGTTKATALALVASVNVFATVSSSKGALLPPASGSPIVAIYNGGANALSVYAYGTDVINAGSAGAAFSVTNAESAFFIPSGNRWIGNLSA